MPQFTGEQYEELFVILAGIAGKKQPASSHPEEAVQEELDAAERQDRVLTCACRWYAKWRDPALERWLRRNWRHLSEIEAEPKPVCPAGILPETVNNPYPGIKGFDVEDGARFYGRGRELEQVQAGLAKRLEQNLPRMLVIAGESGVGKSSFARAGLLYGLRRGDVPGSRHWPQRIMRPGKNPANYLVDQVVDPNWPAAQISQDKKAMETDPGILHHSVQRNMRDRGEQERWVLLVDQAEEAFTIADTKQREAFFRNLLFAAAQPEGKALIILTIQENFLSTLQQMERGWVTGAETFSLQVMQEDAVREVIEEPARKRGGTVEAGLSDLLLRDAGGEPGQKLALIQDVLANLWALGNGQLRLTDYVTQGGLDNFLLDRARKAYRESEHQEIWRELALQLAVPSDRKQYLRVSVTLEELPGAGSPGRDAALRELLGTGLLIARGPLESPATTRIEVSHEILFTVWRGLRWWLRHNQNYLQWRAGFRLDCARWQVGRRSEDLLRGERLRQAKGQRNLKRARFTTAELQFVRASERHRLWKYVLILAAAVMVATAGYGAKVSHDAKEAVGWIAEARQRLRNENSPRSMHEALLIALHAEARRHSRESEELLREAWLSVKGAEFYAQDETILRVLFEKDGIGAITFNPADQSYGVYRGGNRTTIPPGDRLIPEENPPLVAQHDGVEYVVSHGVKITARTRGSGETIWEVNEQANIRMLQINPDQRVLAIGRTNGQIVLLDLDLQRLMSQVAAALQTKRQAFSLDAVCKKYFDSECFALPPASKSP
ncbi:MAG: hypothetical protein JNK87_12125 [Bryobacterales bacterium]|nr:hypothetical protein [Bryobacterales bacterium]